MDELVVFLRAQLDEDERVARDASDWPWEATISLSGEQGDVQGVTSAFEDYCCSAEDAEHIARWDPARVLAEVEAKRRILDRCSDTGITADEWDGDPAVDGYVIRARAHELQAVVRLLAQPYAGQDGWREEWRLGAPA